MFFFFGKFEPQKYPRPVSNRDDVSCLRLVPPEGSRPFSFERQLRSTAVDLHHTTFAQRLFYQRNTSDTCWTTQRFVTRLHNNISKKKKKLPSVNHFNSTSALRGSTFVRMIFIFHSCYILYLYRDNFAVIFTNICCTCVPHSKNDFLLGVRETLVRPHADRQVRGKIVGLGTVNEATCVWNTKQMSTNSIRVFLFASKSLPEARREVLLVVFLPEDIRSITSGNLERF